MEACSFRDAFPRFEGLDATVLGVSPDSVESHRKFKTKHELPFTLIADEGHKVADKYGVWVQKSMYGKKYWGNARTTFVLDAAGRVAKVFEKVTPAGHAQEVAAVVSGLAGKK